MNEHPTRLSGEDKYRLLLRVSEAATGELDLAGVLEAAVRALSPAIPVDALAVVMVSGDLVYPFSLFVSGVPRQPGESFGQTARRAGVGGDEELEQIENGTPLRGSATEFVGRTGKAHVSGDLAEDSHFPEDERLRSFGVTNYVRTPLHSRGRFIGSLSFTRLTFRAFSAEEVELLEEVSRPIATAVANALAYREIARLNGRLERENVVLKEEFDDRLMFDEIVGSSPALRRVLLAIEKVAPTDSTVLLSGETGTGKELVARAIHRRSKRAGHALIKANLAALPDALIASELFGHEKGAFTGALGQRIGRFELASAGTIFLDEVGELPLDVQVALLRVLQEREFERVGGSRTLRTAARVIAATNRDLAAAIDEGIFRRDLYYRLNVFPIEMPALRERREDIPILVEYFVSRHAAGLGKKIRHVEKATMERLIGYDWPGNIRELQNLIERAAILADTDTLSVDESTFGVSRPSPPSSLSTDIDGEERKLIEEALRATGGRVAGADGAAARLKTPSTTLESKIKRLRIDKREFRARAL